MARTKDTSSSIFAQLQIDANQKKKLEGIEKAQLELEAENKELLTQYEKTVEHVVEGKEEVKTLSLLDQGIQRGVKFKGEITDLVESLTQEFDELGQFVGDLTQYKGIEIFLAGIGLTKWAHKQQLRRVKQSTTKQNMHTIIDYGHYMVQRLDEAVLQNYECYARIGSSINTTVEKLEKNQPLYHEWRDKVESMEKNLAGVEEELLTADADAAPALHKKKSELQKQLDEANVNKSHYFTMVEKAKQALPVQRAHHQAYKDMIESLKVFRTGLEQQIENVTEVYLAAPTAIQTALSMKSGAQYDKAMKRATDITTDAVLKSVKGVLDESASRAERPLIEAEKLEVYRKLQREMRAEFDRRMEKLEHEYAQPPAR